MLLSFAYLAFSAVYPIELGPRRRADDDPVAVLGERELRFVQIRGRADSP